jgi:NAD(P)-dependent dehydrogenase (short-subunit alcohol dehydrogenase family)
MTSLQGKRALVTGAARGIGRAIVEAFDAQGAIVAGVDLDPVSAPARSYVADLADLDAISGLVDGVEADLGGIDILVNCAAIASAEPVTELSAQQLSSVLAVNLQAPALLASRAARGMVSRGWGRIVNITSVHAQFGAEGCLAYDMSKAGLTALTRTMAIELSASGVLVNSVAPGFVDTRETDLESPEFLDVYVARGKLPIRRGAQPDEVAAHVAWLASPLNTYVTGASLAVDGGLSASF